MKPKIYKRGLTLGKFLPFHKGHQFLLETALKEVEELIVVVYDSSNLSSIALETKVSWIKHLYPEIQVIAGINPPFQEGNEEWIQRLHEDYLQKTLGISSIDAFYSSEFYGDHISKFYKAVNRLVEPNRTTIKISGTQIRKNTYQFKEFLNPLVYKSLLIKVLFLGGPSTGKSTITEFMAKKYSTTWMPEYGREYWEKNNIDRRLTLEQLYDLALGHIEREDQIIQNANRYFFVDTSAITTYLFSLYYHDNALNNLKELADKSISRYDIVIVCDTDIPYDNTEDRSGEANREYFQKSTLDYLKSKNISYHVVRGNLEQRSNQISHILENFGNVFYET